MTSPRIPPPESADGRADADCRASLTELYGFLDGELTPARRTTIRSHLEACNGCLETYDFETELRMVISSCCREKELPPGLRERIAQVLRELPESP